MTNTNNISILANAVRAFAKASKNFDEYFTAVYQEFNFKGVMHKKEFDRLVQVAAVEANLE